MKRELQIHIAIDPGTMNAVLTALLLAIFPAVVGSETVTLQTYYPAPYGIYTQVRSTELTSLSETGAYATRVGVDPTYVESGGTTEPKFHVIGDSRLQGNVVVWDKSQHTGAPFSLWVNQDNPSDGTKNFPTGGLGAKAVTMGVNGKVAAANYFYTQRSYTSCNGLNGNSSCTNTQYATWVPGFFNEGRTSGSWPTPQAQYRFYTTDTGDGTGAAWRQWGDMLDLTSASAYCCPR